MSSFFSNFYNYLSSCKAIGIAIPSVMVSVRLSVCLFVTRVVNVSYPCHFSVLEFLRATAYML